MSQQWQREINETLQGTPGSLLQQTGRRTAPPHAKSAQRLVRPCPLPRWPCNACSWTLSRTTALSLQCACWIESKQKEMPPRQKITPSRCCRWDKYFRSKLASYCSFSLDGTCSAKIFRSASIFIRICSSVAAATLSASSWSFSWSSRTCLSSISLATVLQSQ